MLRERGFSISLLPILYFHLWFCPIFSFIVAQVFLLLGIIWFSSQFSLHFWLLETAWAWLYPKLTGWKNLLFGFSLFLYWASFLSPCLLLYKYESISIVFRNLTPKDVSIWGGDREDENRIMCCPKHSFAALLVLENCFIRLGHFVVFCYWNFVFICFHLFTYCKTICYCWTYYLTLKLCILPCISVIKIGISIIY